MVQGRYVKSAITLTATCCLLIMSCTGNKTDENQAWIDSDSLVSVMDSATIVLPSMPQGADVLFDDFFFNFAGSKKMQLQRVAKHLQKDWKYDSFFMKDGYYTLIFRDASDLEVIKDTNVNKTIVEKIFLKKDSIRQYHFNRINGNWILTEIKNQAIKDNINASFLRFYYKFANDTKFQEKSMHNPVKFIGPNPDNDFENLEGEIIPATWAAFCPEQMPKQMMYNIIYGDTPRKATNTTLFVISGIANGLEIKMTFAKEHGVWKMQRYEQ
ncbi:MAG: DUF4348 domain-containing protein [Prevotella sp.]|nr:DUF4348 domain-containing protein [Candidatus Equicola stercoris]